MGEYADLEIERIIEGFERRAERREKQKPKIRCGVCGKMLKSIHGVEDHMRDVHGVSDAEIE